MSFVLVGFVLANLQLDLGLWVGYAIKLAGGLFMLGGIYEIGGLESDADRLRPLGIVFTAACAAAALVTFLLRGSEGLKYAGIAAGVATTALAALMFRKLLGLLKDRPFIADNAPEVGRLIPRYGRMMIVLAIVLAADALNRFTGGGAKSESITLADITGVIMFFTKIVSYVYLAVCAVSFNTLRRSYSSAHPLG